VVRSWPNCLWYGAALATLFFYPLISGLVDGPEYFQWRRADSLELLTAFVLMALVAAVSLRSIDAIGNPHLRLGATLLLCAFPFASFGLRILRQLDSRAWLVATADAVREGQVLAVVVALLGLTTALLLYARAPARVASGVLLVVAVLSPLTLLSAIVIARCSRIDSVVEIRPEPDMRPRRPGRGELDDILVVVFDELDYGYLYREGAIQSRFPSIRRFSETSDNYHRAESPAPMTIPSMLGLLTGWRDLRVDFDARGNVFEILEDDSRIPLPLEGVTVFSRARAQGYRTALYGWGLPYCGVLVDSVDACRSFSSYNFSDATANFSPLAPLFSTLILWPFELPFGWLKAVASNVYQRERVAQTFDLAVSNLSVEGPLLQLVHLSIPHAPFVYDREGYRPSANSFLQSSASYIRQLDYVDRLFGMYVAEVERQRGADAATIVLLSDHAYRSTANADTHQRIPLLVKRSHQVERRDIYEEVWSERVLNGLVSGTPN
jgi:hypothetical protein